MNLRLVAESWLSQNGLPVVTAIEDEYKVERLRYQWGSGTKGLGEVSTKEGAEDQGDRASNGFSKCVFRDNALELPTFDLPLR